jgi:uncharacterized iron-regulated membrane protein
MNYRSTRRTRAAGLRRVFLLAHRYVGLALAPFLIVLGLTGSIITFNVELERAVRPQLFATSRPGDSPLGLAALAQHAEALAPEARLAYIILRPDQAIARMKPRSNGLGPSPQIDFDQLFLNPFTGAELGRRREGDLSQGLINLHPVYLSIAPRARRRTNGRLDSRRDRAGLDRRLLRCPLSHVAA